MCNDRGMSIESFPEVVRRYADQRGLSKAALARMAGLHPNTLRDLDKQGWSPNWKTALALNDLMKSSVNDDHSPDAA